MTSSSVGTVAGDGTNAHSSAPAAALSASTRSDSAWSRSLPNGSEFSISMSATTSASRASIAATIFVCCRSRFAASAAPRASQPVRTVIGFPARSV